jgi:propionyl-CoA carboxylase beta chain
MKLGRLNHIGVATPSIADSIVFYREVMGAKGAVEIIFRSDIGDPEKIAERTKEYEDRFANPFVAASKGFIDEVIYPHSTRKRIALGLRKLRNKALENAWKKHDNIPL